MRIEFTAFPAYDLVFPDPRRAWVEVESWQELRRLATTPSPTSHVPTKPMTLLEDKAKWVGTDEVIGYVRNFCIDSQCANECCSPAKEAP